MSIVMTEAQFACSGILGPICIRLARKHHIRNSNKNLLHGPGYRLVKAVELSLKSWCNTQLRNYTMLDFLAVFEMALTRSFSIIKTWIIFFQKRQYLWYNIIWGIVFPEYFNQKLLCLIIFHLSNDKLARKIYFYHRLYVIFFCILINQ